MGGFGADLRVFFMGFVRFFRGLHMDFYSGNLNAPFQELFGKNGAQQLQFGRDGAVCSKNDNFSLFIVGKGA